MQSILINNKHLKQPHMPELKLKQLQYETDSWKHQLEYMSEECVRFKNRLSEILKDRFDKNLLEEVDGFQSRFIKHDEIISVVRDDIVEVDNVLTGKIFQDGKINKETGKKLMRLRNNMTAAERRFIKMKSEFNKFLSENIL